MYDIYKAYAECVAFKDANVCTCGSHVFLLIQDMKA